MLSIRCSSFDFSATRLGSDLRSVPLVYIRVRHTTPAEKAFSSPLRQSVKPGISGFNIAQMAVNASWDAFHVGTTAQDVFTR